METENNQLICNFPLSKPRVNSAPEVLAVINKKHKSRGPVEKHLKHKRKSSQSSISIDVFRSPNNNFKNTESYLSISRNFSIVSGRRLSSMEQNKEKFEIQFCRINVLLISMQLGLGFSMSGLGVYLRSVSPSLTWKDCTYWAGLPLLCSGAFGLYFCLSDHEIYKRSHLSRLVKIVCACMSVVTAALTLSASIMSGTHGKWISDFSSTCDLHFIREHSETDSYPDKCCEDKHTHPMPRHKLLPMNDTMCVCKTAPFGNFSLLKFEREYAAVTCRYVFSALKDYFILQSSLMGVATGVCIWIVILQIKDEQPNMIDQENISRYQNHRQTGLDESPSPSYLRFFPNQNGPNYINKIISPSPKELQIPKVIVHEIIDKN